MSNLRTDIESPLALEPEFEEPDRPLHEYAALLFRKIELLWAQKWLLTKTTLLGFVIAAGISLTMPARYAATALLMPPATAPLSGLSMMIGMKSGGAMTGALGGELNDMLGMRSTGQLYIRQMQSRPLEDNLIKRFDLSQVYKIKSKETARKVLEGMTEFEEDRKTGIISIKVTDTDPNRAAAIANGYAEELGRLLSDLSSSAGRREREYFESELVVARQQLAKSSKALSEFSGKNAALNIPLQDAAIISAASAIQGQLIVAEAELKSLLPVYTENYVRVRETRAKIAELQRQLDGIRGKTPSSNSPASNKPGESATADNSSSKMNQLAGLSVTYMDLFREAKTNEALVDTLSQQYEIAKLQESRHVAEVQLLDPAQPPERKSLPKRRQISMIGLFLGLLIGVTYVMAADWWNNSSDDNEWKKLLRPICNNLTWRKKQESVRSES